MKGKKLQKKQSPNINEREFVAHPMYDLQVVDVNLANQFLCEMCFNTVCQDDGTMTELCNHETP